MYREVRQSLATIPHAVPLKPSHRCIDTAVSGPLQVGTPAVDSSESRPHPAPRSRGGHGAPPGTTLRNPVKQSPTPYRGRSALRSGRLHALRRKLVAPSEKHLRVLDARVHADRTPRPRHPTRQQVSPAVIIARDVHDRRRTRLRPHGPYTRWKPHGHRLHVRRRVPQQRPTEFVKVRVKTAKNDIAQHIGTFRL